MSAHTSASLDVTQEKETATDLSVLHEGTQELATSQTAAQGTSGGSARPAGACGKKAAKTKKTKNKKTAPSSQRHRS